MNTNTNVKVALGNGNTSTLLVDSNDVHHLDSDGNPTFTVAPVEGGSSYAVVAGDRYDVVEILGGVYSIPESRFSALNKKFATLAKKAAKVGCEAPTYTVIGSDFVDQRSDAECVLGMPPRYEEYSLITVEGGKVKYAGWRLLGVIESDSEALKGTYLVNVVPGETIPAQFRDRDSVDPLYCDHCRSRRYRKATFIVAHDDGEVKQVGRQCIRDFLGHSSPERLASYMQYVLDLDSDLREEGDYSTVVEYTYTLIDFLTIVRTVMREGGWVSRGMARNSYDGERATADIAWEIITPAMSEVAKKEQREWLAQVTDNDRKFAQAAIDFAPTLWEGVENVSDYVFNMQAALSNKMVGFPTTGLVASLLSCYAKHLEMEIVNKRNADRENKHLGTVGEKLTVKAEVSKVRYLESQWGTTTLIHFLTDEGNTVVWFASGSQDHEVGERYNVAGTVKKHDTYKNQNQTVLTRCGCTPVGLTYVKLTKKQAELVSSRVETSYSSRPETVCLNDTLLCVPATDVENANELVSWLSNQGRVGKGAVKKIEGAWDTDEMGDLTA